MSGWNLKRERAEEKLGDVFCASKDILLSVRDLREQGLFKPLSWGAGVIGLPMAGRAGVAAVWSQVCWPLWSRCGWWGHQRAVASVCAVVGLRLPDHQAVPLPLPVQWGFLGECTYHYNLDSVFWVACQCIILLQRLPSYFHCETALFYNTLQQLACELSCSQSCWSFAPKCWLGCFVQYFDWS